MAKNQIILIGRRIDTALLGVRDFRPDRVHLVYTPATADVFGPFAALLAKEGVRCEEHIVLPYDAPGIRDVCRTIKAGLASEDTLQYNLTEGTKVAALSAMDVAREYGDPAVYYSQEGDTIDLSTLSQTPNRARICNEEFFEIFGNTLSSYNLVSDMLPVDVASAYGVKQFIEHNQKTYQRIQHQYRSQFGGRIEKLPAFFKVDREHNMNVEISGGSLTVTDRGAVIFKDRNPLASRLFFTGRWWETIVSALTYKWDLARHADPSDSQVWRNVEFTSPETGRTKNELDVLVNDRRRLILLECKSGYIAQENVYKIDSVRETYGGDHSIGVLVSYYPLEADLARKCRDLQVEVFAPESSSERTRFIEGLPSFLDNIVKLTR